MTQFYQGKPCRRGHDGVRYASNNMCRICVLDRVRAETSGARKERHALEFSRVASDPIKLSAFRAKELARGRKSAGLPMPPYPAPALCECCNKPPNGKGMALDHDHVTGAFRGWLCGRCNGGMGLLGDNLDGVMNAVWYLKRVSRTHLRVVNNG